MIFHVEGVLIIGPISRIIRVGGILSAKLHIFLQIRKFWCIFAKYFNFAVVKYIDVASNGVNVSEKFAAR